MHFQINITVSPEGVAEIRSQGASVVIVRQSIPPAGPPVAWIAFAPMTNNVVSWEEAYQAYWSTQPTLTPGLQISVGGTTNVQLAEEYTLLDDAFARVPDGPAGAVMLRNASSGPRVVGLYGAAVVNGENASGPIDAAVLQQNSESSFVPTTAVTVFVGTSIQGGTVLNGLPPNALTVNWRENPANLIYDVATGGFEQV